MFFMVATFFFFLYETEQMGVSQLYLEKNEIETKTRMARLENERLSMEVEDLKTDIGVIKLARERLRLVFPGEIVVKAVSSEEVQIQKLRNLNAIAKKYEVKPARREEISSGPSQEQTADEAESEAIEPDETIIDDSATGEETEDNAAGDETTP
ncbi:MAG TPA: septum formation initiator family protein [Candidatus Wallbacteria bacterium]|nr:septum formation initiator family protein [Candidatus Wallbacteria bacterium]